MFCDPSLLRAAPALASIFGEHMVLQRDRPVAVWGHALPGEHVSIILTNGAHGIADTDAAGNWKTNLPSMHEGGPFTMTVADASGTTTVRDVMVGEVWVLSGQSNMAFPLNRASNATEAIPIAKQPQIRLFTVAHDSSPELLNQVQGQWSECTPDTARDFSAVGYFFGLELSRRLNVPIGLIHSSWPGSSAEEWIPSRVLAEEPEFAPILERWKSAPENYKTASTTGLPFSLEFANLTLKDRRGKQTPLSDLSEGGSANAINGHWSYSWEDAPETRFELAPVQGSGPVQGGGYVARWSGSLRHQDTAVLTLDLVSAGRPFDMSPYRELSFWVRGHGFLQVQLLQPTVTDDADYASPVLQASGAWQIVELPLDQFKQPDWGVQVPLTLHAVTGFELVGRLGSDEYDERPPSGLFNGMIAPLMPYTVRGVVWYQGESNALRAQQYRKLLPALIQSWRTAWRAPDLQFLLVQLPNHGPAVSTPQESAWAELREAQLMAARLPGAAMTVTIDLGEPGNVHPADKIDVGKRLALTATGSVYGKRIPWSGPIYDGMDVINHAELTEGSVRIRFRNVFGGLRSLDGKPLRSFAVAGGDHRFVWAQARIDGDFVIISSPLIAQPEAVRYDWADTPDGNLTNDSGVPASPFRTDSWPGLTDGKR